jgi:prepilin-type N-terminal cleavage/methylation domain-containing protein
MRFEKLKKGFTLAEVLLTLVIIGVIAALTIPALLQNIQDVQLRTAWEKTFSDLSAATAKIYATNGDIDFTSINNLENAYESVLVGIKKDNVAENLFSNSYNYYKNSTGAITFNSWGAYGYVMPSGATIAIGSYTDNGGNGFCTKQKGSLTTICAWIYIDVNGKKPPNMFGKDFFQSWILKKNGGYIIYPSGGTNGDGYTCVAGSDSAGTSWGCSTNALLNGPMP